MLAGLEVRILEEGKQTSKKIIIIILEYKSDAGKKFRSYLQDWVLLVVRSIMDGDLPSVLVDGQQTLGVKLDTLAVQVESSGLICKLDLKSQSEEAAAAVEPCFKTMFTNLPRILLAR